MSNEFDAYARDYSSALNRGLRLSGEGPEYFAERRVQRLKERLKHLGLSPRRALDFGCGTGTSGRLLLEHLQLETVLGVDPSSESIAEARKLRSYPGVEFATLNEFERSQQFDLAFCNGVFHHIQPGAEREKAVRLIFNALGRGGVFAFWENNPWNPGTRLVMSRIPFDRDAVTLSVLEAKTLLRARGFQILGTDFCFVFPHLLRWLRCFEAALLRFPIGGQYQVLCRKPMS
jgi:SAM-dependent methyltransferase